jgi:CubicO group peptidase (beta-lactamase class C family)
MSIRRVVSLSVVAAAASVSLSAQTLPLPRGKPEDVGMSSARLNVIATTLKADVERGRLPGAVIAIARRGKVVCFEAFGYRDKAALAVVFMAQSPGPIRWHSRQLINALVYQAIVD